MPVPTPHIEAKKVEIAKNSSDARRSSPCEICSRTFFSRMPDWSTRYRNVYAIQEHIKERTYGYG